MAAAERLDGLGVPAHQAEHLAEVAVGLGVIGIEPHRLAVFGLGLRDLPL